MKKLPEHIVVFDGVCNFCNVSVNFILKHNKKENLYFSDLQSPMIQKLLKNAPSNVRNSDSILFYSHEKWHTKSQAILQIAEHLEFPYNAAKIFKIIPVKFRDAVYDIIAKNRYKWFGKKTSCKIPNEQEKKRILKNFLNT